MFKSNILHLHQFLNFIISMLAITNPAGSVAVFLSMTGDKSHQEQKQIALTTTLSIFVVLVAISWAGLPILQLFGISLPAFEITGGLILLLRSLAMLHAKDTPTSRTAVELQQGKTRESIAIVPLAIPIIAGPGAMTTTIIYTQNFPSFISRIYLSIGLAIVAAIVGAALFFANTISNIIGATGVRIVTRIMGLILAAIAMSMITNGIKVIFPCLG